MTWWLQKLLPISNFGAHYEWWCPFYSVVWISSGQFVSLYHVHIFKAFIEYNWCTHCTYCNIENVKYCPNSFCFKDLLPHFCLLHPNIDHSLFSATWIIERLLMHCVCPCSICTDFISVRLCCYVEYVALVSVLHRFNNRPPLLDAPSIYFLFSFPFVAFFILFSFLVLLVPPRRLQRPVSDIIIITQGVCVCVCIW